MLTCDEYLSPRTLDEAFDAMANHRDSYRLVAGATDILPWAREGRAGDVHIPVLIDVAGIPELNAREVDKGKVRLGAATRFQRFLDDKALATALPALPFCAIWFADDQIRESATIGGNLVDASPAADGTPALLAHDATVVLARRNGGKIERRKLPLAKFALGPGKTEIAADEILLEVQCDAAPSHGGAFEKVGHRRSLVISTVCVAALVQIDATMEKFRDVRVAVAGIGPVPQRAFLVEHYLKGRPITDREIEIAASGAIDVGRVTHAAGVSPRGGRGLRRARAIANAAKRAGASDKLITRELEARYA